MVKERLVSKGKQPREYMVSHVQTICGSCMYGTHPHIGLPLSAPHPFLACVVKFSTVFGHSSGNSLTVMSP